MNYLLDFHKQVGNHLKILLLQVVSVLFTFLYVFMYIWKSYVIVGILKIEILEDKYELGAR